MQVDWNFGYSLALVLVAQIPLLLKLYFDYKGKKDPLRESLFLRQLEAYAKLVSLTTRLQRVQHGVAQFFGHEPKNQDDKELLRSLRVSSLKERIAWSDYVDEIEVLVPSDIAVLLAEYNTAASQIIGAGDWGTAITTRAELEARWDGQCQRYNAIVNALRLLMGTDALSSETLRVIHESNKHRVLESRFEL